MPESNISTAMRRPKYGYIYDGTIVRKAGHGDHQTVECGWFNYNATYLLMMAILLYHSITVPINAAINFDPNFSRNADIMGNPVQ